jgi:antitoxin component YwqK of YwqJK toxin-antitoxin module
MRQLFLLSSLLLLLLGCSGETEVVSNHPNGMIAAKGYLNSDGLKNGVWTTWSSSGQKLVEAGYKNGVREGLTTEWYEGGQKFKEVTFKNGKKELETRWNRNGEKNYEWSGRVVKGNEISRSRI